MGPSEAPRNTEGQGYCWELIFGEGSVVPNSCGGTQKAEVVTETQSQRPRS